MVKSVRIKNNDEGRDAESNSLLHQIPLHIKNLGHRTEFQE